MELEQEIITILKHLELREYIKLVILFGSRARGDYHDNSDIDLGFLFNEQLLTEVNSFELRSELIDIFSTKLSKECDVIIINQAPPLLRYQILKYGKRVFQSEDFKFNSFFSESLKEYFDFKYYLDFHHRLMINRIKTGGEKNG